MEHDIVRSREDAGVPRQQCGSPWAHGPHTWVFTPREAQPLDIVQEYVCSGRVTA